MTPVDWHPPQLPEPAAPPRPTARSIRLRIALGIVWLGLIAVVATAALTDRPHFAEVRASAVIFLVVFSIPGVVLGCAAIRNPAILIATAAVSGAVSAASSWSIMRDTSSTAAIGVLYAPVMAFLVVGLGWGVDRAWRR